jgi:hypothetical protein
MKRRLATLVAVSVALLLSPRAHGNRVTEWAISAAEHGSEKVNNPVGKIVLDAGGYAVVGTAEALYGTAALSGGWWIATGWKATDLTAKLGDAALKAEDESRGAQMILADRDAALLKKLHAEHVDLNTDPRALAAKDRLRAESDEMSASGLSSTGYLLAMTRRHLTYAAAEVILTEAMNWGMGKLLKDSVGGLFEDLLPSSKKIAGLVDGRSRYGGVLATHKWTQFAQREKAAQLFTKRYAEKLNDIVADRIVEGFLKESSDDLLNHLCEKVHCDDPARPVFRPALRLELTRFEVPPLPAQAMIVPAPAAAAIVARPEAIMRAAPVQVEIRPNLAPPDPVQTVIQYEDRFSRQRSTYEAPSPPPPPPPEPVEPPPPPSEAHIRWQHEWDCAGAGNKPGCGDVNWDGR